MAVKLKLEIQCSIVGFWLHPWQSSINLREHGKNICMLMIRQVYLTLPRNYYYFASGIDLWTDCQLITFRALWFQHAPELSKEVDYGMAVYLLLALKNPFPLMSVSSSVDDQGPVHSNGVGSYSIKIPETMDRESVLFWIGQRFLIHITQEGCSGLSHI